MASLQPRGWISAWFLLTLPVIIYDATYCFFRPRSMVGGDLHWIWKVYEIWEDIDHIYGVPSFQSGDGFTNAQSFVNMLEQIGGIAYLYLAHVAQSPAAPVVAFGTVISTLSKTVLYWAQEYYCGFCAIGHNGVPQLILWVILNGIWIVVPAIISVQLYQDLAKSLRVAARAEASTKKSKYN
ncbi:hypothetical protein CC1G_06487 [Coprinopsis cinerea okayama7|uniref:EXPERA domain-containing protein n=1 Tax=Coprinopsis cinerea (strain Okayama-7 / 130 / ATCC MYA-4618 / FGSC 9003) TaxID=240176 RepID=A8NNA5_COPC7|nr:hypothetical protein CC1G_06487 [Coprinopsis cinerea okayama7\|eukprot:XP_001835084.1 hypothetical protein CC1G_06487 [Coprinopsis cinerea okayama7\